MDKQDFFFDRRQNQYHSTRAPTNACGFTAGSSSEPFAAAL
jgi:hypothetical protein